jgi:hypothetical protein
MPPDSAIVAACINRAASPTEAVVFADSGIGTTIITLAYLVFRGV